MSIKQWLDLHTCYVASVEYRIFMNIVIHLTVIFELIICDVSIFAIYTR